MTVKCCGHCGMPLHAPRSLQDHKRLFSLFRAAHENWPEDHPFQPANAEQLRKWLTAKAGYRDITVLTPPPLDSAEARHLYVASVEAALAGGKNVSWVVPHRDVVAVIRAKSIAWDKLGQAEFGMIRDAISAVIERELGVAAGDLLRSAA